MFHHKIEIKYNHRLMQHNNLLAFFWLWRTMATDVSVFLIPAKILSKCYRVFCERSWAFSMFDTYIIPSKMWRILKNDVHKNTFITFGRKYSFWHYSINEGLNKKLLLAQLKNINFRISYWGSKMTQFVTFSR